ncbi:MAG: hypothetical protein FWC69_01030 [Defluviitaleaceae bacterium]|nr:hypothetical protein [Defluviitaleaceae bacterium]
MNKFFVLLRLQMMGVFGINKMLYSKKSGDKAKIGLVALGLVALFGFFIFISYNWAVSSIESQFYPAMALLIVSMSVLILSYFRGSGVLFGHKDYDATMSLPVSPAAVVLSRILMLYFMGLLVSIVVFAPGMVAYAIHGNLNAMGFVVLFITMLLAPAIPLVIAVLVGTLIVAMSSRFRHANLVALALAFVGIGAYFYFVFTMSFDADPNVTDPMVVIGEMFSGFYPPSMWVNNAVYQGQMAGFALFAAISLVSIVVYTAITSKFYVKINTRLSSTARKNNYKLGELRATSPFKALYKREMKRVTTSVTYALNIAVGPLLITIASIALLIIGRNGIANMLGISSTYMDELVAFVTPIAFAVIIFFGAIFPASAANLSLEGRNAWIMSSLPLKSKTIINSKLMMSLTMNLPATILASVALAVLIRADVLTTALLIITPAVFVTFNGFLGMFLNVKFPKYDWESEYKLLKGTGSAAIIITLIVSIGLSVAIGFIAFNLAEHAILIQSIILAGSVVGIVALNVLLSKSKLYIP